MVSGDRVLGEGWHERAGEAHAEVRALAAVGDAVPQDATLYITLEPCCTQGRTPPCTDLILRRGIRRVVVAAVDPNPAHAGRGLDLLRAAGVDVVTGVMATEAEDLNLLFNHAIVHGAPLFAVKVASTLDGRTATRTGASQWITGAAARADVARWRRLFPAIAIGAGTLLADNPRLTARWPEGAEHCGRRLILDPRGVSAGHLDAAVFTDDFRGLTVMVTGAEGLAVGGPRWKEAGVAVWALPDGPTAPGRVDLAALRRRCWEEGLTGVYWETGPRLLGDLLAQGQVDYVFHYQAPVWWGDAEARPLAAGPAVATPDGGWRLAGLRHERVGEDTLTRGWLEAQGATGAQG